MWVERNGRKWRVREKHAGAKITLAGPYPTRDMAEDAMILLQADEIRGDALVPRGGDTTVDELLDLWWPTHRQGLAMTARDSEGSRIRHHIRPLLGTVALKDIDTDAVNRWIKDLENGAGPMGEPEPGMRRSPKRRPLAPKTVANIHGILFVAMRYAVKEKLIRVNPCAGATLPCRVEQEMRCLTDDEIGRLLAALPEYWRPLVLLMVTTGLRWGEAVGLKLGRLNLTAVKPYLRVEEQLQKQRGVGGELVFVPPKSARSRRTVTFDPVVARALRPLVRGKLPAAVVFTTMDGSMIRDHHFRPVWLAAREAAGLPGLRVHDLRHTHAGMLLSAGVPIEKVSRRLGHAAVAITDRIYGHLRPNADEDVMAAVADSIEAIGWEALDAEVAAELADEFDDDIDQAA